MKTRLFFALFALTLFGCSESEPLTLAELDPAFLSLADMPSGWVAVETQTVQSLEPTDDPCQTLVYDNGNFFQVAYGSDDEATQSFIQSIAVFPTDDAAIDAMADYVAAAERCNAGTEEERDGIRYEVAESSDYLDGALVATEFYSAFDASGEESADPVVIVRRGNVVMDVYSTLGDSFDLDDFNALVDSSVAALESA